VAGIATVLALVLSAASSSPAFAVTQNHDGTVSVALMRSAGIVGANAKLSALGVRARIVPQAAGCGTAITATAASGPSTTTLAGQRLRIDPGKIPAGRTLVIAARGSGQNVNYVAASTVSGAAPACLPPPITAGLRKSFFANAQCMRTHGVPNFPDPTFPAAGGISFDVAPGSFTHEARAILQASKACVSVGTPLPDGAVAGQACARHVAGGSGNSGNTGAGNSSNSGSVISGNSGNPAPNPPRSVVVIACGASQGAPPSSGNSGNSGNPGNSGSGNSGNS
jgi:hypothetical protein